MADSPRRWRWRALGIVASGLVLVALLPLSGYLLPLRAAEPAWRDVAPAPLADEGYLPQGLALVDGALFMTAYHRGEGSVLLALDATHAPRAEWRLPPDATHASGLAWDGRWLWLTDYDSDALYRLDLAAADPQGGVLSAEAFPLGLRGTSAVAVLSVDGADHLAISDFGYYARTYILPVADVERLREARLVDLARVSYANGHFSQGLAWDGARLYESVNHLGRDVIRVLDVVDAVRSGDPGDVRVVAAFLAPGRAVEGIAFQGSRLYALDEAAPRLHALDDVEMYAPAPSG